MKSTLLTGFLAFVSIVVYSMVLRNMDDKRDYR